MRVYIMRGLPGSGKSTWAKDNLPHAVVCSADHFHTGSDGVYRFDPANAGNAHGECLKKFAILLETFRITGNGPDVVVDNTNTTAAELAPYVALSAAYGVEYEIVFIPCDFATACYRNTHRVPRATIWHMMQNLNTERLPVWWKQSFAIL